MLPSYATLEALRQDHPAWRLLRSDHAALISSFLHRCFIAHNQRTIAAVELAEALDDELYTLRLQWGEDAFPRSATDYLNDWSAPDRGWLRKFYKTGTDEAQFDLTPATEKAIGWLSQLGERQFVGTESRLLILFELLKQMSEGSEADPEKRLAELKRKRATIDEEIARVSAGEIVLLEDSALKDRFQQFTQGARQLLADFREVEFNFRQLDRRIRERIAQWDGSKGALLQDIMGERDAIAESDQGRSFRAFWDFLLSSRRQEELGQLLDRVLSLPAVASTNPDPRTRRVHYDWLEAGEHTQRTVAALSQQLRRFLDDRAWLENRRIIDLLHAIEVNALAVREAPPPPPFIGLAPVHAEISLATERPLHTPSTRPTIEALTAMLAAEDLDPAALFEAVMVDRDALQQHIDDHLQESSQVSLGELVASKPLQHGLAELLTYLQLGTDAFKTVTDERSLERIDWESLTSSGEPIQRAATLPRVIFIR
jgi:hypothetical protein